MPTTKKKKKPTKKKKATPPAPITDDFDDIEDDWDDGDEDDDEVLNFTPSTVNMSNLSGRRRRKPRRRFARGLFRDYVFDARDANPDGNPEEWLAEAKDRLEEDFGDTPWLDFLLELFKEYAPILIELLLKSII